MANEAVAPDGEPAGVIVGETIDSWEVPSIVHSTRDTPVSDSRARFTVAPYVVSCAWIAELELTENAAESAN